ncbi:MAG: endonuclease/exonuclease/phosphatase family protein [Archangium sp.]|nr:endonuclease/exonuclease/phosphatase family protein [Archangium sp.]MDP3573470.1 endonuclease/exonuclease/phosphatase family protein [Archangium sp.]
MNRALLLLTLTLTACGPEDAVATFTDSTPEYDDVASSLRMPSEDRPETVDVGSWNVEWFGAPDNGPLDEVAQQRNVKNVIKQTNLDLIGLVEVVSEDAFKTLMAGLPAYEGLLVTDPRVTNGAAYYSANEQKVALLYKRRFTVDSAKLVLMEQSYAFAGRPPMEVHLSFTEDGAPRTLVVMVTHFKAMANSDGYTRRITASNALKWYLDGTYPSRWVLVVGDFNDDIDVSTYQRKPSPLAPFVNDPAYRFTTDSLSAAGVSTTANFSSTIDHHLATDELARRFVADSAKVLRPEAWVTDYVLKTSDHYPVVTRYDLR